MPNIENNTMSTFTIGGKTFEIEDASARSNIQTINTVLDTKTDISDMSNYYTKSETYNKTEVDDLIDSSGGSSGGGGSLIVGCTINGTLEEQSPVTLTSTWQEIYDAAVLGKTVILDLRPYYEDITYLQSISSNDYQVMFSYFELFANSPNDYPTTPVSTDGGK